MWKQKTSVQIVNTAACFVEEEGNALAVSPV
jgi:hypothetical protein